MILYIDTKIIQKLNKATPFRSVFPIPSIKNIFQEIYINENLKYIIEMKLHTVEFISISPTSYTLPLFSFDYQIDKWCRKWCRKMYESFILHQLFHPFKLIFP